ncbi:MAG: 3-isopropylmalate/(R)-2-methylmalate dehydratase small subunit [Hyphomicrobiaceae bacterium]|jgi:3-isopropylmalate/(R)-2-methylmalate dehydratase small subunit
MTAPAQIRGGVVHMGDDLNTDVLHPSRFYSLDASTVKAGFRAGSREETEQAEAKANGATPSIIVGGRNFGYGSSRETTLQSLVLNGFQLVIATTVSRIFWRNAVNAGLWVLQAGEAIQALRGVDELLVVPELGSIADAHGNVLAQVEPPDAYDLALLCRGGMSAWLVDPSQPL